MIEYENSLMPDKKIDIISGERKCAYPGKTPLCKNCPDKFNKFAM